MAALSRAAMLCVVAALLLSPAAVSSYAPSLISMPTDKLELAGAPPLPPFRGLAVDYHDESCPDLQNMVYSAVEEAFHENSAIAAGLLRIYFHDCFVSGCDASLLLNGTYVVGGKVFFSEQLMGPNVRLQPKALQLIEDIRVKVHDACGPTVSCADIMVLATRDAVVVSGGHSYDLLLGRNDSFLPARGNDVSAGLPPPTLDATQLISFFQYRGFDENDLVALSGAHTIGKAHCDSFSDRFDGREDAEFVQSLAANCSAHGRLQDLDVATPRVFDNAYYRNLVAGKGVLTSDQTLMNHPRTKELVEGFAAGELNYWFFNQFGTSMKKLSLLDLDNPEKTGEVRRYGCFRPNAAGPAGQA